MPELPEVETIRRSILTVSGARVERIRVLRPDIVRAQAFPPEHLNGKKWESIRRRGKFLSFVFSPRRVMTLHLGMSGRLYAAAAVPQEKHVHMVVALAGGPMLIFQDPRRFGGVWFTRGPADCVGRLGVEPLEADFTEAYLAQALGGRKTAVKNTLLDQRVIAGLGNIYADEALFAAGILPFRPGRELAPAEIARLREAVAEVLTGSIAARGTTFRDYRDGFNRSGAYQRQLKVYGRAGQACFRCGEAIRRIPIGGRSSHYCPACQR
jgi:formamidopyrimidine-DNA glycosylase